jgi:hypothetical protein
MFTAHWRPKRFAGVAATLVFTLVVGLVVPAVRSQFIGVWWPDPEWNASRSIGFVVAGNVLPTAALVYLFANRILRSRSAIRALVSGFAIACAAGWLVIPVVQILLFHRTSGQDFLYLWLAWGTYTVATDLFLLYGAPILLGGISMAACYIALNGKAVRTNAG